MTSGPRLTVLMAVYNDADWLHVSIPSILTQTLSDFEFIIVNDGSTDSTAHILEEYATRDDRIIVHNLPKNSGLPVALNAGLAIARTDLIARHDADDVALPDRLQVLYDYMVSNPDCAIVGSHAKAIDAEGNFLGPMGELPMTHDELRCALVRSSPFIHPAVMFRRHAVIAVGAYDPALKRAQDYDLWFRVLSRFQGANLPDCLLHYRVYPDGYKKKKFKNRLTEVLIRWRGFSSLRIPWWQYIYVLKPILVGLLPNELLRQVHIRRWRSLADRETQGVDAPTRSDSD